jgi:hypothetical protein
MDRPAKKLTASDGTIAVSIIAIASARALRRGRVSPVRRHAGKRASAGRAAALQLPASAALVQAPFVVPSADGAIRSA